MMLTSRSLRDWVQSMWEDEVAWMKEHVKTLRPNPIIINIGAAAGVSTLAMLEERPDALIYSCEIDPGAGELWSIEQAGLDKNHIIRLGESAAAGLAYTGEVDFIFVDGGHDTAQVTADIDAWLPHLKAGSVIAFHDYEHPAFPDVKVVVDPKMVKHELIASVNTIRAYQK